MQKLLLTLIFILTSIIVTTSNPVESPQKIGLFSSEFLQILLKMGINPEVEHWPISGGRSVSGEFKDESHFEGIVHYPESDLKLQAKGQFLNFEPSGQVVVTFKNGTVVNF